MRLLILTLFIATSVSAQETNLALHRPAAANSANSRYPASNITDGLVTRESKWESADGRPPHILEVNLQRYCNISRIVIHTGIPEKERTPQESVQAAGFWSAKNFKLQYWDDANWTDIPGTEVHENRLTDVPYSFSPALNTYKIRFVCDDGEPVSVMEIEILGTATDRAVPGDAGNALATQQPVASDKQENISVSREQVGLTMKYIGYNQGYYMPGSNASGWLEYSNANAVRVWTTLNSYVPVSAVQVDKTVGNVEEFDRRKALLRADPEHNSFIRWEELLPLYNKPENVTGGNTMVLSYALAELKRLHIDPLLQISGTDFNETWSNKWQQWQRFYALAFYAARTADVTMFAMQNEPNHKNSGPMKLDQWIAGMRIVSDAIGSAIADVNRLYHKSLVPRMVGPVTAGNNPEWWTAVARNMRTDYHGKPVDHDLLGIFSTHSYNSPAAGYAHRVSDIRKILVENQPGGKPLPIVYTEIGRWMNAYLIDKEETMDDPSLFTEWAGIYANNTLNGAYGMWAFKFSNTATEAYPEGVKSGHHFTWHGSRIVEDAYHDLAAGRPVRASNESASWPARNVTDGNKHDASAWHSAKEGEKWLEIDLGSEYTLGSGVIYTGSDHGVYTAPDRVKDFSLQYEARGEWKDIPGFTEKGNKYAQVFEVFDKPVTTRKIRFVSTDAGMISVREIKLFAAGDGPAPGQNNYDVTGIQRTGEVVRLFATGFKDQRPLFRTTGAAGDPDLDALTSYDSASHNYYMWLVQRGSYTDYLNIDLSSLGIPAGSIVTEEIVDKDHYGEARPLNYAESHRLQVELRPQSVVLLTIPSEKLKVVRMPIAATGMVGGGKSASAHLATGKGISVSLNAAKPEENRVSYMRFTLPENAGAMRRVLLRVSGSSGDTGIFRMHVYAIPDASWDQKKLTWNSAPQLDPREALITGVGSNAFVAGELALDRAKRAHYLDVTDLVKNHGGKTITFAFIRETREAGDDYDKGRIANLSTGAELIFAVR